jgi:type I restriction enzyme S subunit
MKKYDSYKDSGVEWIGEVPTHWGVDILNRIFKINTGFTPSTSNNEFYENGVHDWITIRDLDGKYVSESKTKLTDIAVQGKTIIPKGSLLYSFKLSVGQMAFTTKDIYTNEAIFSVFPSEKLNLNYYYYLLDRILIHNSNENIYGAKILNQELIKASKLLVPPEEEQTVIANFLDHKTTQINDLISKKEQFIQLLEEERVAVINQAVTKGLDPSVPMKDSGIEWLGEIPEHWEVKKLAFEFQTLNTKRIPLSAEERGRMDVREFDYYGASGVIDKVENYLFDEDLILIGEDGANLLTRSKRLVFIASGKYWVNNHAHIIKPINGNINYFCELLELIDYTIYITGSAQPKLTQEALMSIKIPVPPISEQILIFNFLEHELETIDKINAKTQQEIELLKEYKTALISEVVTGKVDVRNEKLN